MENYESFKIKNNPFETFDEWLTDAIVVDDNPWAFALATSSKDGEPSVRYLLHKGIVEDKFRFFTNYSSHKASDLEENPRASMAFFWRNSKRQVRISGSVKKTSRESSEDYFNSRDLESRIASSISTQSAPIESREVLISQYQAYLKSLNDSEEIKCPENWGGYELSPDKIEFFIYGEHRLNDRFIFSLDDNGSWSIERLQP
ncbi:pyridoxamine 5'-phosphate oxidase [Halobacteriovorax sp. HLS]|uniref:pyridoxamine 5'-phosphate oxidase n=1 Tax=Halobacteriovorax sp. HLS TaxID=2234000 RepID=UPI000FD9D3B4|nr:pyridoxamine 5'-phosphate oxidase [Halobacteriovorax sp. HLS]